MLHKLKRYGLAAALAAGAFTFSSTAEARDHWRDGRNNDAAIAIGAGIVGLAIGALIADRDDGRYYDRGYYRDRRYVRVDGHPGYYYYYNGNPNRYYRDRYYDRYYGRYHNNRNRWDRGYDRIQRYYGGNRYDRRDWHRDHRRDYRRR